MSARSCGLPCRSGFRGRPIPRSQAALRALFELPQWAPTCARENRETWCVPLPGKLAPSQGEREDREIAATDAEIDNLVYELYGITDEGREIIEGKNA